MIRRPRVPLVSLYVSPASAVHQQNPSKIRCAKGDETCAARGSRRRAAVRVGVGKTQKDLPSKGNKRCAVRGRRKRREGRARVGVWWKDLSLCCARAARVGASYGHSPSDVACAQRRRVARQQSPRSLPDQISSLSFARPATLCHFYFFLHRPQRTLSRLRNLLLRTRAFLAPRFCLKAAPTDEKATWRRNCCARVAWGEPRERCRQSVDAIAATCLLR